MPKTRYASITFGSPLGIESCNTLGKPRGIRQVDRGILNALWLVEILFTTGHAAQEAKMSELVVMSYKVSFARWCVCFKIKPRFCETFIHSPLPVWKDFPVLLHNIPLYLYNTDVTIYIQWQLIKYLMWQWIRLNSVAYMRSHDTEEKTNKHAN